MERTIDLDVEIAARRDRGGGLREGEDGRQRMLERVAQPDELEQRRRRRSGRVGAARRAVVAIVSYAAAVEPQPIELPGEGGRGGASARTAAATAAATAVSRRRERESPWSAAAESLDGGVCMWGT